MYLRVLQAKAWVWNKTKCKCSESRKNWRNSLWLNPKGSKNGESAAKPRTEVGSETIESIA